MSRPVLIRNGSNSVKNVKDKSEKLISFGNQYHIYMKSLDIPVFDLSSEQPGGIVTYNNKLFGIVVVPQTITGDNSIRIMAVPVMSGLHPSTGSYSRTNRDNETAICTGFLYRSGLKAYSFNQTKYNILNQHYSDQANKYNVTVTSANFYDGFAAHKMWIQLGDEIGNFQNWRTAVEILETALNQPGPDIAAKYHGSRQERGYSEGNMCCWRFSPISDIDTSGYWYMPSIKELRCEYENRTQINSAFSETNNLYNTGVTSIWNRNFRTPDYDYSDNVAWGGSVGLYNPYTSSKGISLRASVDPNTVQAFCKLIKENGKWILDPTYHID